MTTEPMKYKIETMQDFCALTIDQRKRCVPDLLMWADMMGMLALEPIPGLVPKPYFIWVDDGASGEISGIRILDVMENQA